MTNSILAFGMPGGWELVIIVLVIVLLFGAKKIPELAKGLGRGIREFKDASKEIKDEIDNGIKDEDKK
ncbi:Sec-independent protein translocase subunit TatA/TatB [Reichenbachiella ulvae]|uniref:Sec-independent protein translocase protein TatA n=1 Tax=Reichenbachiella ulvae TaxID=2980104 RepID=A0ABT3CWX4_9BACT|nr:twin-arginine translocase TatA/TatE family subunit [Reichenbachiella ulvae]MCV9388127.1 twin-arginine translocase TatA/TatE family subunit [Reichenbachiella ulvae]